MSPVRLTYPTIAPNGCVPRTYSYWSQINQHRGDFFFYVFVGRVDQKPALLLVRKADLTIAEVGEVPWAGTGENWYFSDTLPYALYVLLARSLLRYNVVTGNVETVCTLDPQYGAYLWQPHSSADDAVHSATVRDADYQDLGCVVFRRGVQHFFPKREGYNECHIDRSGRFLIIEEGLGENRIIDLDTANADGWLISDGAGAVGHCDVGDGILVGEDDSEDRWQVVLWDLRHLAAGKRVLYRGPADWGDGMGHCAVRGDHVLIGSTRDGIYTVPLDGSGTRVDVAPSLLVPGGGGIPGDWQVEANWDPTGEFCCWLANERRPRFDLYLARVNQPQSFPTPAPQPVPTGGSVIPISIFTQPEEAACHLHTDGGRDYDAHLGTFDGRPAWVFDVDADTPNGHGGDLTITYASGAVLSFHGFVRTSPPEFVPNVYREPVRP